MKNFECQAILFDLDGVLVDSTVCVERHWQIWAQQHGLDIASVLKVAHGRTTLEAMQILTPNLSSETHKSEAKSLEQREATDTTGVVEVAGAALLLKMLPPNRWAVVTSADYMTAITRMRHTGLPLPQVLVTADNISQGKPHPEGYLKASTLLGVAPQQCVVIEDAPPGIQAAIAADMSVIGVATTYQPTELSAADICVQALADIQLNREIFLEDGSTRLELLIVGS